MPVAPVSGGHRDIERSAGLNKLDWSFLSKTVTRSIVAFPRAKERRRAVCVGVYVQTHTIGGTNSKQVHAGKDFY